MHIGLIVAHSKLGIAHGEGTEILERALALLCREQAVGGVLDVVANAGSNVLGGSYNDRHDGINTRVDS